MAILRLKRSLFYVVRGDTYLVKTGLEIQSREEGCSSEEIEHLICSGYRGIFVLGDSIQSPIIDKSSKLALSLQEEERGPIE